MHKFVEGVKFIRMRAIPLLLAVVGLASWAQAFQGWKGFRFGTSGGMTPDQMWAVGQLTSGKIVVAGGANDSLCCKWDSVGRFYSSSSDYGMSPLWERLDTAGTVENKVWTWGGSYYSDYYRWFDLKALDDSGFLAAGTIGDTVIFSGTYRARRDTVVADTLKTYEWREVIAQGGGGGIGISRWSSTGALEWMRLLRVQWSSSAAAFRPGIVGRQLLETPQGDVGVSGYFDSDSGLQIWEGTDSFSVPAGSRSYVFHVGPDGSGKWLYTSQCPMETSPRHVVAGTNIWLAQADSLAGAGVATGNTVYHGWQPSLHRLDLQTGAELSRVHPLGDMQGCFRAIATHENGSLLLQGEQSSSLTWNGKTFAPQLDTSKSIYCNVVRASFLALLDSSGNLLKFRSLHGLSNAGAWKILRIVGKGWLLLSIDEQDALQWGRLYLMDDSLNVVDSSDTLPQTRDEGIGNDGRILLAGSSHPSDSTRTWLSGTGSMWAGWCRLGGVATGVAPRASRAATVVGIRQDGRALRFSVPDGGMAYAEVVGLDGSVRFRGPVDASTRLELPRGSSVCRLTRGSSTVVRTLVSW